MKKENKILAIQVLFLMGLMIGTGYLLLLANTFYTAYFSGSMKVLVNVNEIGEAHYEAILIPIVIIINLLSYYLLIFKKDLLFFSGK